MHRIARQFLQYVVVGGLAFTADFLTLFALTRYAGFHYLVSATLGFLIGLAINYLLCVLWIFDYRSMSNKVHEFVVFTAIGIAGLALNNGIIYALTEGAGVFYLQSKIVAAALILLFNFGLRRALLFTRPAGGPEPFAAAKDPSK